MGTPTVVALVLAGSHHTHRHPGSPQATSRYPQAASSGCAARAAGQWHRTQDTSTRPGPHSCPCSHRFG